MVDAVTTVTTNTAIAIVMTDAVDGIYILWAMFGIIFVAMGSMILSPWTILLAMHRTDDKQCVDADRVLSAERENQQTKKTKWMNKKICKVCKHKHTQTAGKKREENK